MVGRQAEQDDPREANTLRRSTLMWIFVVINSVYLGLGLGLGGRVAIESYNVLLLAGACAVVFAYTGEVAKLVRKPLLDGTDILTVGIWASWFSIVVARLVSIVWRLQDKPPDWLDSVVWGGHISGSLFAMMCHLLAPEAVGGRVPTRQWIKIGIWTGLSIGVAAGLIVYNLD